LRRRSGARARPGDARRARGPGVGLDPGEEHFVVHFPLEWVRDPNSRYLREYPVDIPWDEPELVDAIVAQVMANFRSA
jgi:hypothetical protein